MKVFSSQAQLEKIEKILSNYIKLPFSGRTIPGGIMEAVLANVHGGLVLNTYDFADVILQKKKIGWQVKSTKESTPVTWKRAKIPNSYDLIQQSRLSKEGLSILGREIINFCNSHARESLYLYGLEEIGYSRLIIHESGSVTYFEKLLCTIQEPNIFNPDDFEWHWSSQKNTKKKEQLQALHGINIHTGAKWWAWHGLGENQLHFSGEKNWWPKSNSIENTFTFKMPGENEKISLDDLMLFLSQI